MKEEINHHEELREAFFRFRQTLYSTRRGKQLKEIADVWHKVFLPAHKLFLKNEKYLNKMLNQET